MMDFVREIEPRVKASWFQGRIVVIYGPRRAGKTTLVGRLEREYGGGSIYLNCDEPDVRGDLTGKTSTELGVLVGRHKLVVIDEAQRVKNIGLTLKLLADNFEEMQIIATGSSAFDLSNQINEPLTGRKWEFYLYPLAVRELAQEYSQAEMKRLLEQRLRFGSYPEVVVEADKAEAIVREIAKSYLYKDMLEYQTVKNPEVLRKLLQALALQIGNEVSYNELANLLEIDRQTVERYVRLLEQAMVVFRLGPFSRNLRKELGKLRKIYFWDLGVRNALINNFNRLELRQDVGALWENWLMSERLKRNSNAAKEVNTYYWRTYRGQKIDYIEEVGGRLTGFEMKWRGDKWRAPRGFLEAYPGSEVKLINQDNWWEWLA